MTVETLTAILAQQVMGWGLSPDRFLTGNRGWVPRWRFQPAEKLEDAFHLLEKAAPEEYSIGLDGAGRFRVQVRIGGKLGVASRQPKARAITLAVARALGLDTEGL